VIPCPEGVILVARGGIAPVTDVVVPVTVMIAVPLSFSAHTPPHTFLTNVASVGRLVATVNDWKR
jgi:hypothetical protein